MPPQAELSLLSLTPIPISNLPSASTSPDDHKRFTESLQAEARELFASKAWSAPQTWHHDVVQTRSLPRDAVSFKKNELHRVDQATSAPPREDKKRGWRLPSLGSGSSSSPHDAAADGGDNHAGIGWHVRESVVREDETGYGFQVFWDTLAERHMEQEVEYVDTLAKAVPIGDNSCYLKLYSLPFPTANRSFLTHLAVVRCSSTRFQIFSVPVQSPDTAALDKGYVRGLYVAVEEVEQVETEDGQKAVRWRCASMSSPGGSIPTRLAESHMPSSLASHVPAFFRWLSTKYGGHGAQVAAHGFRFGPPKVLRRLSFKSGNQRRPSGDGFEPATSPTAAAAS